MPKSPQPPIPLPGQNVSSCQAVECSHAGPLAITFEPVIHRRVTTPRMVLPANSDRADYRPRQHPGTPRVDTQSSRTVPWRTRPKLSMMHGVRIGRRSAFSRSAARLISFGTTPAPTRCACRKSIATVHWAIWSHRAEDFDHATSPRPPDAGLSTR